WFVRSTGMGGGRARKAGGNHIAPIGTYGAAFPKGKGLSPFGASARRTVAQRRLVRSANLK
ncbi:hypothetical protein DW089_05435, partial [Acidaminococcus sp. AM05-11]